MQTIKIPYHTGTTQINVEEENLKAVIVANTHGFKAEKSEVELIKEALANPIGSKSLKELAEGKKKIVLVTSDHTRAVPSKITLPILLDEIRQGSPDAEIVILVATGLHRPTTVEEQRKMFGDVIVDNEKIVDEKVIVGRFFYDKDGNGILEELSKVKGDDVGEGFLSAGETLGLLIKGSDAEFLEININGDESVVTYDDLTKRFLEDEPLARNEVVLNVCESYEFPQMIFPQSIDDDGFNNFVWLYKIPYKTVQSLESWATLREKSGDSESIDKNKLLSRIMNSYELVIKKEGKEVEKEIIKFDVFERWDTVLNRNVSSYLSNYLEKWRIEIEWKMQIK